MMPRALVQKHEFQPNTPENPDQMHETDIPPSDSMVTKYGILAIDDGEFSFPTSEMSEACDECTHISSGMFGQSAIDGRGAEGRAEGTFYPTAYEESPSYTINPYMGMNIEMTEMGGGMPMMNELTDTPRGRTEQWDLPDGDERQPEETNKHAKDAHRENDETRRSHRRRKRK